MPITSSISAPIGTGITRFVSEQAKASGKPILLVYSQRELLQQWKMHLPKAEAVSCHKLGDITLHPDSLVIVTPLMNLQFQMLMNNGLAELVNEVWLFNRPLPFPCLTVQFGMEKMK